jgi:hypothetical protein
MRTVLVLLFPLLFAASAPMAAERKTTQRGEDAFATATGAILRGDAEQALAALEGVPEEEFSPKDASFRACMFARFDRAAPPRLIDDVDDAFVRDVLRAYRDYWWRALKAPERRAAQTEALERRLRDLLGEAARSAPDFDALEPVLTKTLEARGYRAQLGVTQPLRELMLWRSQQTRHMDVQLPGGPYTVEVDLLDDFVALGWSAYGRCDRGSNGGWATDRKLYAIVPAYDKDGGLGSEAFRVVFLGHETQHFADKNRYPDIASWELEYRAKLVELAQARQVSAKRLRGFIAMQGDDVESPHTYANRKVIAALTARLGRSPDAVPVEELQAAAKAELLADDARRAGR